ncbi:MAG: exosortase [Sedimentisphaerales bacterium]|nr:exosortase [Sedimentisphaerales bacterium]
MDKLSLKRQKIKAVVLAGSRDFGRCSLTSRLPVALWPVLGTPVLERLLTSLADQGIRQVAICSNGYGSQIEEVIHADNRLELKYLDEKLPAGTAGCIRDAAGVEKDALLLVFSAGIICPPEIDVLVKAHREGQSDLTVIINPVNKKSKLQGEPAGIYVCETSILKHIPKAGYFDIKEGLIPEMLSAGKTIHAATLSNHVGNFRDRQGYLFGITNYLRNGPKINSDLKACKGEDSQAVWISVNAKVEPEARICGPTVVMDGAHIASGAIVLGPAVLEKNVTVGKDCIVINSVLCDGAQLGSNCQIRKCVLDHNTVLRDNVVEDEKSIPFQQKRIFEHFAEKALKVTHIKAGKMHHKLQSMFRKQNERLPNWIQSRKTRFVPWLAGVMILIAFFWCYKAGLADLWNLWHRSDEYSSGLLVPFLAVYILWSRRMSIAQCQIRPAVWGILAFIVAQSVRVFGLFRLYSSAERLSIVLTIAALVLLLFGWQLLRKVFTVLLFLCLMLPWPNRIQTAITVPLQQWATSSAVFCLEMVGYDVIREGNVIDIGGVKVAVAEACNGLRMITAFFIISGLVVLLVKRAWWEKLVVLISSLPIALLCNTIRLAITAIFFTILKGEYWEQLFHDFGGYAMMPLALAAIVAELWLLTKLTTIPEKEEAIIITRQMGEKS